MNNRTKRFNAIFEDLNYHFTSNKYSFDKNEMQSCLSCLYFPGSSFSFLFNFNSKSFDYVSPELTEVLGYPVKNFSPDKMFSLIHEEDVEHVLKCYNLMSKFLVEYLPVDEKSFYKVSFHYRLSDIKGNYKFFLGQGIICPPAKDGIISRLFCNCSDISQFVEEQSYNLSFIDLRGIRSYYNVKEEEDFQNSSRSDYQFSLREIEIIKLVSEGLTTKEISEFLTLSPDTIRTHRNNILKKSSQKKLTKVVSICIKEGLI